MANALTIEIKESKQQLQSLLKKQPNSLRSRVVMLLAMKKSKTPLSKIELAQQVGVNPNSIQKWRTIYRQQGIDGLLQHSRGGKRREVITPQVHQAIQKRLHSAEDAFSSFKQLQEWVDEHFIKGIKYITIHAYVKKHFGAKLKVARKSHIHKSEQSIAEFKKNSGHHRSTRQRK